MQATAYLLASLSKASTFAIKVSRAKGFVRIEVQESTRASSKTCNCAYPGAGTLSCSLESTSRQGLSALKRHITQDRIKRSPGPWFGAPVEDVNLPNVLRSHEGQG